MYTISVNEFERAKQVISGGVNSPVRSLKNINGNPIFIKRATGVTITDVDQNQYIDYSLSRGAHILGHAQRKVLNAVEDILWEGTGYGMPTTGETNLAELIVKSIPSIEMVRFTNSETEAFKSAIRLARKYTGRNKIIKLDGNSKEDQSELNKHTLHLPFNSQEKMKEAFAKYGSDIAAIVVEPIQTNKGVILPVQGFLQSLRDITTQFGALLLFDETTTGFRPGIGGAQVYFGIAPDITILGKIIGGGFPIGAFGGKKEIMQAIATDGDFNKAGSLTGNLIATTAGLKTLQQMQSPLFYKQLNQKAGNFIHYLGEMTNKKGITVNSFQSMFTMFFTDNEPKNYEDAKACDLQRFDTFNKNLLENGIYFSPSQFETNFISAAHTPEDLNKTLEVINKVLKNI